MASWVITKDHTEKQGDKASLVGKIYTTEDEHLNINKTEKFRLYDGDNHLYYEGFAFIDEAHDETGFEPLDWGTAYAGCTHIEYWNEKHRCWDVL